MIIGLQKNQIGNPATASLSQEKLGVLVGLSQKQISRIENYGINSLWKVKNIATVFGITVDELIEQKKDVFEETD